MRVVIVLATFVIVSSIAKGQNISNAIFIVKPKKTSPKGVSALSARWGFHDYLL